MVRVDDVSQLPAIDVFFIHPHLHCGGEALQGLGVTADNPGYGRAPGNQRTDQLAFTTAILSP